jgi:transposase
MARAHSQVLGDLAIDAAAGRASARSEAERFGVDASKAIRWAQCFHAEGVATPEPMVGDHCPCPRERREIVLMPAARQPDLTAQKIRAVLSTKHSIAVALATIGRSLPARDIGVKKKSLRGAEQGRSDVVIERRPFVRRQPALALERLIFLDKAGMTAPMTQACGRYASSVRPVAEVLRSRPKTSTLGTGPCFGGIAAPYVFDESVTCEIFRTDMEQVVPPLRSPGTIVGLDKLSGHKVAGIREAIEAQHAQLLRLPPYSPDLNPIESAFSRLRAILRNVGYADAWAA